MNTADLIDAGAILPMSAAPAAVPVSARTYTHAALAGRVVVRMVPDALGEAEDLALDVLGMTLASVTALGYGKGRAMGFPAWALINDPANARHALALVQDLERSARTARSKPGNAKDDFDRLAAKLGRSAPHFLPTFLEQAGRAFLEAGSKPYAAMMFARAREAERVHGLPIDESRLREVFLEFAFAGALSAKALTEEARQLVGRKDPQTAYTLFRQLCLERTNRGLPPYSAMAQDLRRLAKAAGLDSAAEDDQILRELLDTPATASASAGFWTAYRTALVTAARKDPAFCARLLKLQPTAWDDDSWFGLLDDAGAATLLTEPTSGDTSEAVRWLEQVVTHRGDRGWQRPTRSPRLLHLVNCMLPILQAATDPVKAVPARSWLVDLDLLDVLLSAGVPVADPVDSDHFFVEAWIGDSTPGARPLSAVAADPRFAPMLREGVAQSLQRGSDQMDGRVPRPMGSTSLMTHLSAPGLAEAARAFVRAQVEGAQVATVREMSERLDQLAPLSSAAGVSVDPAAFGELGRWNAAEALADTLRAGIIDELGWPALQDAAHRLGRPKRELRLIDA